MTSAFACAFICKEGYEQSSPTSCTLKPIGPSQLSKPTRAKHQRAQLASAADECPEGEKACILKSGSYEVRRRKSVKMFRMTPIVLSSTVHRQI